MYNIQISKYPNIQISKYPKLSKKLLLIIGICLAVSTLDIGCANATNPAPDNYLCNGALLSILGSCGTYAFNGTERAQCNAALQNFEAHCPEYQVPASSQQLTQHTQSATRPTIPLAKPSAPRSNR